MHKARVTALDLCICLSVCYCYSSTTCNEAANERYQRLRSNEGMNLNPETTAIAWNTSEKYFLLTLVQRGIQYLVCPSVTCYSVTTVYVAAKERYQRRLCCLGMKIKLAIFLKSLVGVIARNMSEKAYLLMSTLTVICPLTHAQRYLEDEHRV